MPQVRNCGTEVIIIICLTTVINRNYRDGNRFRNIVQNQMVPHYDKVGAERGKGMFLRMKVSLRFACYFCCAFLDRIIGAKLKVYHGKSRIAVCCRQ